MKTLTTPRTATIRPHACPRCGGAAFLDRTDEPEWRCLQCGRTVPPLVQAHQQAPAPRERVAA